MEIEADVHFAQRLASNDPKIREKTLKKLGRWFANKSVNKDGITRVLILVFFLNINLFVVHFCMISTFEVFSIAFLFHCKIIEKCFLLIISKDKHLKYENVI